MSVPLLRQAGLARSRCSTSILCRYRRWYVAQAHAGAASTEYSEKNSDTSLDAEPVVKTGTSRKSTLKGAEAKEKLSAKSPKEKKSDKDATRENPLAEAKSTKYLDWVKESGSAPLNLDDIHRYRPKHIPNDVDPACYAKEYDGLVDKLCRSWRREQLWDFNVMLDLNPRSSFTKHQLAELIIEKKWGWPSLKDLERAQRERTEISEQVFPIKPIQLFLLLGKDGAELLQMSKDYNVHISVTRDPLSLRVEGLMPSLQALAEHISAVKNSIVEEIVTTPGGHPVKGELLQPISRLSGAHVENLKTKGVVRICAKDLGSLQLAKRLITRAAFEAAEASRTTLLSYLPTGVSNDLPMPRVLFPQTYSVYPFLSPRALPWTIKSGGAFRLRRVVEWLGVDSHEDTLITGGLAEGKGRIISIDNEELNLKDTLFSELPELFEGSRVVTASFGHVLLPSATTSQRASIVPPFKGFWPFARILEWMDKSRIPTTFVSSLPMALLNSTPKQQKFLLRFFYHAFSESQALAEEQKPLSRSQPSKIIKFEVILAHSRTDANLPENGFVEDAQTEVELISDFPTADPHQTSEESAAIDFTTSTEPRCWAGAETTTNLILPDRPMDIRLTAFDHVAVLREQEPGELQSYSAALQAFLQGQLGTDDSQPVAPSPPNSFKHRGETYVLHKSFSVRQSHETFPASLDGEDVKSSARVLSESVLDLESQQKSTVCEVSCVDHSSDAGWKAFLASCDRLTATHYSSGRENRDKQGSLSLDID